MTNVSNPTWYKGVLYRSKTEAIWARFLDYSGAEWEYEPGAFTLSNGMTFRPDFFVTSGTASFYVEVKGEVKPEDVTKAKLFSASKFLLCVGWVKTEDTRSIARLDSAFEQAKRMSDGYFYTNMTENLPGAAYLAISKDGSLYWRETAAQSDAQLDAQRTIEVYADAINYDFSNEGPESDSDDNSRYSYDNPFGVVVNDTETVADDTEQVENPEPQKPVLTNNEERTVNRILIDISGEGNLYKRACLCKQLVDDYGLTPAEIANRCRRQRGYLVNDLKFLQQPEEIVEYAKRGYIPGQLAHELMRVQSEETRIAIARRLATDKKLTTAERRELIASEIDREAMGLRSSLPKPGEEDAADINALERDLKFVFKCDARIFDRGGEKMICLDVKTNSDIKRISEVLRSVNMEKASGTLQNVLESLKDAINNYAGGFFK